jgi:hypothetical protein
LSLSDSTTYVGLIYEDEINPIKAAMEPPRDSGIITAERAGIDRTAYEVPSAPANDSPVVV